MLRTYCPAPLSLFRMSVGQRKNVEAFQFEVVTTGERPLTRQLREAQRIANDIASGQLINGRNEHIAPALQRLAPTDILNRDRGAGQ